MDAYDEKREARIERLKARAAHKSQDAASLFKRADQMADAIPFGQPILVGHYSEGRDRRYRERIQNTMRKASLTYTESKDLARAAEAAESNTAISSDNPDAVDLLKARLKELQDEQARKKAVNAAYRRYLKNPQIDLSGFADKEQAMIKADYSTAYSWTRQPYPGYSLSNANGNIRRVEGRIRELEAKAMMVALEPVEGNGWRLVENVEENRLQIFFDAKPPERIRAELKAWGFRWSPFFGAWQRQLSSAARANADTVLKRIEELKGLQNA